MPWKECSVMEERLRFVARLAGRRGDDGAVPGVRHLAQDRLQDLRPLQGTWPRGPERSLAAAGALRQPAAGAGREPDRRAQARQAALGRAQDPRAAGPAPRRRCAGAGQEHHPCRARPPRPGQAHGQAAPARQRHAAVRRRRAQRAVVRRLQGRVQARQRPLLLSAHRHRSCLALPARCAKPWNRRAKTPPSPPSSGCSTSAACRTPSAPTTACPSPAPMPCSISPSSPSGGSGSASPSSASSRATRSRTAATSACTSPSRRRRPARRA